jgi:hypothetical protein
MKTDGQTESVNFVKGRNKSEWCVLYVLYMKGVKRTHNGEIVSVCPHVPSPKLLNGIR